MARTSRKKVQSNIGPRKASISLTPLTPKTKNQERALKLMDTHQVVILEGLAGTGKTYMAVHKALSLLEAREVDKIIFTRPLTTVGDERLGFLPGDIGEKTAPFTEQLMEYLGEFAPMLQFEDAKKLAERVQFIPLAYLRGRNFNRTVVIADEMQNSSQIQMKTLLTRLGEDAKLIILGDTKQEDRQQRSANGLVDLLNRLKEHKSKKVGHVVFGVNDIQRSEFVKHVMKLYGDI
jgi:phosphate starvation-inducible PhoH-like protein